MNNRPAVSAVIPVYNRAGIIPRAIRSVLAQTFEDWELVVVDDGSTDATCEVVSAFRDDRIRLVRHPQNEGQAGARNTGIQKARGKYVALLDSDDEWLPGKLAGDVRAFETGGEAVGLVYCGKRLLGPGGELLLVRMPTIHGRIYQNLLAWDCIGSCSRVTIRKSILDRVGGFDQSLRCYEDWDLWLRVAKLSEVACVNECLVIRHIGHHQVSGTLMTILKGKTQVIEKHRADMPGAVLGKHLVTLAAMRFNYEPAEARRMAMEGLRLQPAQPLGYATLCASLLGRPAYRWLFSQAARKRHGFFAGRAAI